MHSARPKQRAQLRVQALLGQALLGQQLSHGRVAHVFQGRYKAILVERDRYLLELARYVVLNPLRAKMVKQLDAWPWSSY